MTFLDLAPELRNAIYELVVVTNQPIVVPKRGKPNDDVRLNEPGITATCHQICSECIPIFYSGDSFEAFNPSAARNWIQHLSEAKLRSLRSLRLLNIYHMDTENIDDKRLTLGKCIIENMLRNEGKGLMGKCGNNIQIETANGMVWIELKRLHEYRLVPGRTRTPWLRSRRWIFARKAVIEVSTRHHPKVEGGGA